MVVLRLDHVADSPIGDEAKRGVSGGERKRTKYAFGLDVFNFVFSMVIRTICTLTGVVFMSYKG